MLASTGCLTNLLGDCTSSRLDHGSSSIVKKLIITVIITIVTIVIISTSAIATAEGLKIASIAMAPQSLPTPTLPLRHICYWCDRNGNWSALLTYTQQRCGSMSWHRVASRYEIAQEEVLSWRGECLSTPAARDSKK